MFKYSVSIVCSFVLCLSNTAWANGLSVYIVSLEAISQESIQLECAISWQNSWYETSNIPNHDATWLFVKNKKSNQISWSFSKITSFQSIDFDGDISKDSLGLILKSNANPIHRQSEGRIQIVIKGNANDTELFLGGVEMVFVPSGTYYLGDAASNHSFENSLSEPILIQSEQALRFGDDISSSTYTSIVSDVPAQYPKGFDAFYCMKYEISQHQMADFLSMLSHKEQQNILLPSALLVKGANPLTSNNNKNYNSLSVSVVANNFTGFGAQIDCDLNANGIANEATDGQNLSCNYLSWLQVMSYLNWSGLRPMTEMEFEKACRGTNVSIAKEYAFGTNLVTDANLTLNDSTANETNGTLAAVGAGIASHGYNGRQGPLRVGFAANETSNRLLAGASFWGIMELSGNLWEPTMGVNKANGLLFTDTYATDAMALPTDWKTESCMLRGGAWSSGIGPSYRDLAVSDRYYYNLTSEIARNTTGGRGVRSLKSLKSMDNE